VYRLPLLRLLCVLLVSAFALPAMGQFTRDNAANKKIDEAVNEHYLATNFDKAEGVLTGTIQACADKCSPQVIAKAWMYVGIVRGSGKNDLAGAKEAFSKAVAADAGVKLDTALATPETQQAFAAAGGGGGGGGGDEPAPKPKGKPPAAAGGDDDGAEAPAGGMQCTPDPGEVQSRRPIPIECTTDEEATAMEIRYKAFGSETWKTVKMKKKGDAFRGEVPCDATGINGVLKVYARAKDDGGETLDSWGSKAKPVEFNVSETSEEAPAYPGEEAPQRCAGGGECPPDFPGCENKPGGSARGNVDWGGPCQNSTECKVGLLCQDNVCETAPSCDTDSDCATGKCQAGKCDIPSDELAEEASAGGPFKKGWLGLHFGLDIAVIGGSEVCSFTARSQDGFACYVEGDELRPYNGDPYPGTGIATGTVVATKRALLSFDYAFTANITAGVRLGYAFGGGPPAGKVNEPETMADATDPGYGIETQPGTSFLPIHAEARLTYWFGRGALGKKGLRPYVTAGGGMAQVDAKVPVTLRDCTSYAARQTDPNLANQIYNECTVADPDFNQEPMPQYTVDAWKKMGQGFGMIGGGIVYAFTPQIGAQLNVNFMYLLPTSGPVLEPSLGITYGLF